jgi:hypothetical protein
MENVVLNALGTRLIVAIITLYHLTSGLGVRRAANSTVVGHCLKVGSKKSKKISLVVSIRRRIEIHIWLLPPLQLS